MLDWFADHNGLEQFFLLCALVGGVIVVVRLILTITGLDDHDGALDGPHVDSDAGFQLLSIQGVAAFFTLFGLVGYSLYRQAGAGAALALGIGVAAGFAAMWLMHRILVSMLRLQSSGSIGIEATIGCEGTVYVTVTGEGGSVQVKVANRLREFEAVSADGAQLPPGAPVRVVRVAAKRLVVTKLS